jgi:L-ornithine Nalpha-acyltransferase
MMDAFVDFARMLKDGSRPPLLPGLLPPGLAAARRRSLAPLPETLGRIGPLEVRLARDASEIRGAQSLRYRVFHEEMSATPRPAAWLTRRDTDAYDLVCDHLLVLDHSIVEPRPFGAARPKIVGTYRLLRQEVADLARGFYSQDEFDLDALVARHPAARFLELGRSCVLPRYRDKRTVELLWHGIWTYVLAHGIDVMVGCASFEGTDPDRHAEALTLLAREARAEGEWVVAAQPRRRVAMDRLEPGAKLDAKRALAAMPPLLKGYLRLGARFGDGAVIDRRFGTTDVFVVLPRSAISERYIAYFGADASRHAA